MGVKTKQALDLTGLGRILYGIHDALATISKTPELKLSDDESNRIASAAADVAKHYNIEADPKIIAWVGLGGTCIAIYGPRMYMISERKAKEVAERKRLRSVHIQTQGEVAADIHAQLNQTPDLNQHSMNP